MDSKEVKTWQEKASRNFGDLGNKTTGKPWTASLWGCFTPVDVCALSCCCPCIVFGKTAHRMDHNGDMTGYSPLNTSCILFYLSGCIGASFVLQAVQSAELRKQHNLEGGCVTDILKSCCCICCTIVQTEKEAKALLSGQPPAVVDQQYTAGPGPEGQMVMPQPEQQQPMQGEYKAQ